MKRIAPEWNAILLQLGVKPTTAAIWSEIFAAVVDRNTFSQGDRELDDFLGQVLHESGMLERLTENLNYSAERLMVVWPKRFPTLAIAKQYERNPQALANKVYANRLGNGDEASGEGYAYRGRGLIQVTGKVNYELIQRVSGLPVLKQPDLLAQPLQALQSAIAWWEHRIPDRILGDIEKVSVAVNGGTLGLAHRTELTGKAGEALA